MSESKPPVERKPAGDAKARGVSISQIFLEFLIIGATSFGGVVPYLRGSVVSKRQWLSNKAKSDPLLKRYEPTVKEGERGGVPVLEVRPKEWKDNGKAIVYTHGGAHVTYSAAFMLGGAAVAAHETGLRVISVVTLWRRRPDITRCRTRSSRRSKRFCSKASASKTRRFMATLPAADLLPRRS